MTLALLIIFSFFLLVVSILDWKFKAVPSILLTSVLFVLLFIRFENIQWVMILGVFSLLIWEFSVGNNVSFGVADIKVMAMFGFFINNLISMSIFLVLFGIGQVFYLFILRRNGNKEVPFIPFFLLLWIIGVLGGSFV